MGKGPDTRYNKIWKGGGGGGGCYTMQFVARNVAKVQLDSTSARNAISSPEAAFLLVSTKDANLSMRVHSVSADLKRAGSGDEIARNAARTVAPRFRP